MDNLQISSLGFKLPCDSFFFKNSENEVVEKTNVKKSKKEVFKSLFKDAKFIEKTPDGKIHFDNMRWGEEKVPGKSRGKLVFSDCFIDTKKLKDCYLGLTPSKEPHTYLVFEFEKESVTSSTGQKDSFLVLSFGAKLKVGQRFEILKSFDKNFKASYQLCSWKDILQRASKFYNLNEIYRYKLNLTEKQKEELLKTTLDKSFKNNSEEFYHLLNNSCYTKSISLVNSTLPIKQKIKEWFIKGKVHNIMASIPSMAYFLVSEHNLLKDKGQILTKLSKNKSSEKCLKESKTQNYLKSLTNNNFWDIAWKSAGLILGASVYSFSQSPPIAVLSSFLGYELGEKIGSFIKFNANTVYEDAEKYLT